MPESASDPSLRLQAKSEFDGQLPKMGYEWQIRIHESKYEVFAVIIPHFQPQLWRGLVGAGKNVQSEARHITGPTLYHLPFGSSLWSSLDLVDSATI